MDLDPGEENPMWAAQGGPHAEAEQVCRIALRLAEMRTLTEGLEQGAPLEESLTWDAPRTLLADDADLAERVRAAGVPIPRPAGTYAERQWDAREALEEAAHRYHDHNETWGVRGMVARQPAVAIVRFSGNEQIRRLLERLVTMASGSGLVLDARDPRDLRVFGLPEIAHGRVIVVLTNRTEERQRGAAADEVLRGVIPSTWS